MQISRGLLLSHLLFSEPLSPSPLEGTLFFPFHLYIYIFFSVMDTLPVEIVDIVLNYLAPSDLASACSVSRTWLHIISPRLYRRPALRTHKQLELFANNSSRLHAHVVRLDLRRVGDYVTDTTAAQLVRCSSVQHMDLSGCKALSSHGIDTLLRTSITSVSSVLLASCSLSQTTLDILRRASTTAQLQTLNLSNTKISPCWSIDASNDLNCLVAGVASNRITRLDLSYCAWVSDSTLENLGLGMPRLEWLSLRWCQDVSQLAAEKLVGRLRNLRYLDARCIPAIAESQVVAFFNDHPSLEECIFSKKRCAMTARRSTEAFEILK